MKHLAGVAAVLAGVLPALCAAAEWEVVKPESRIGFVATYDDIPFKGSFESFDARIHFDPDHLDDALFDIRIDVVSVDSNSRDRDDGMRQSEWFDVADYPRARFRSERFRRISGNRYEVIGELRVKGTSKKVEIPFSWDQPATDTATLVAGADVDRRTFEIGSGEWAHDDIIGFKVKLEAHLKLTGK